MSWFKRLCMFVFGLAGLLALVALCLTWVGPWTTLARSYLEIHWYFVTLEVLVCIAAAGLLVCLLVSLFAPRNPRETIIANVDGGKITVTRAAISSQAKHVVEADGTCIASSVSVRVRKRGHVRVHVRVTPKRPVDVVERGRVLYGELEEGLARVCGDCVQSVDVVFTEPEQPDLPAPGRPLVSVGDSSPVASQPVSASQQAEITVPVSAFSPEPEAHARPEEPVGESLSVPDEEIAADEDAVQLELASSASEEA